MIEQIVSKLTDWGKNQKGNPYFSANHKFGSELRERLSYHAEFDVFPDKLINSAAPNEDPKEFKYRKDNYKQITKPYWDKALSATYRIFNPQNFSIDYQDEDVKDYFTYTYPRFGNYFEHFKDVVHKMKFADPNAVLVVKPKFIPGEYVIEDEQEVFKINQSELSTPITELYSADNVFDFKDDWCLLLTKDKSIVKVGGKDKQEGLIFEFYDAEFIYKIIQTGDQNKFEFVVIEYYQHGWEQMPCWKLKGVPYYDPEDILYYSHFMCAVPNLDEAAFLNSTSFGVINKVAFPTRWYYEDSCSKCTGGWVDNFETHEKERCAVCDGTGKRFTFSFGKDYIIPFQENNIQAETTNLPTPPFGVVDPPVDSIRFLDEKVKYKLESAFLNVNIHVTEKPTGVTATEVEDDKDEFISFLMQLSGEEFYLLQESFNAHTFMRWKKEDLVEVNKPTEFRVRSSADLIEELKTGIEANLPSIYLQKVLLENTSQRFQSDKLMEKTLRIVSLADPLMTVSDMQINSMVSTGQIEGWRAILHAFIYNFINLKLAQNENYLDGQPESIQKELEDMAKGMMPKTQNSAKDIFESIR